MTRRRTKRKAVWVAWTEELSHACRLAGPMIDWTPPAKARLTNGDSQRTLSARFTGPEGEVATIRIRIRRNRAGGDWSVVDENLTMSLGRLDGAGR